MPLPERTTRPPSPFNPRPHQLLNNLQPLTTNSLMPTTRTGDPANQWLVSEPIRIEKQYWKDRWSYRELFAVLAWRPLQGSSSWRLFTQPLQPSSMLQDPNTQLPSESVAQHL